MTNSDILSAILFLIGLPISYFMGRIFAARKGLAYAYATRTIVSSNKMRVHDKLQIHFDGKLVEELHQTTLIIWNPYSTALSQQDFSSADPLRFSVPDGAQLLDVRGSHANSPSASPAFAITDETVQIKFELLNRLDAVVCIIYWVGVTDDFDLEERSCSLLGTLAGVDRNFQQVPFVDALNAKEAKVSGMTLVLASCIIVILIGILAKNILTFFENLSDQRPDGSLLVTILIGVVAITISSIVIGRQIVSWYRRQYTVPSITFHLEKGKN